MQGAFEILTNFGAGAGCVAYALALRARELRAPAFERFSVLATFVGGALLARGVHFATGSELFERAAYVLLAAFPVCAGVFAEAVLRRRLHLAAKLLLLVGTAFFAIAPLTPLFHAVAFRGAFFAYQLGVLAYLVGLAATTAASSRGGDRSLRVGVLVGGLAATGGVVTEWLPLFAVDVPRLGAVGVFALTALVAAALHGGATFRLRAFVLRVAAIAPALYGLAAIVRLLVPDAPPATTTTTFLVFFFAYLVADPLRHALAELRARPREVLLERLAAARTSSLAAFVADLATWPELRRVELCSAATIAARGFDRVDAFFVGRGGPVDARTVKDAVRAAADEDARLAAEQAALLLESTGCDRMALLAPGGPVLAASFHELVDDDQYGAALYAAASVARLLARAERP